jgi:hypothetical protein
MRIGGCVLAAGLAALLGAAEASAYSCPEAVLDKGATQTAAGVDPPWARHELRTASFYEGDPRVGIDLQATEEIKLDRIVQSWDLSHGRVTVICRYRGTRQTVQALLPATVKRCQLTTLKEGVRPPQMECN